MIEFSYSDHITATRCRVEVSTTVVGFEAVVEAFKTFMRFAGYHPDTVDRIQIADDDRQEMPVQMELFPDEHEEGGV